jgi:phosphopantetheinyl transferase
MLLFAIGETRILAGDIHTESDIASAISTLPAGVCDYLSQGKSLALKRDRLAAIRLLFTILEREGYSQDVRILRDGWGRPQFDDSSLPDFNISHSDGFVAVALGDGRVGIDLQSVNPDFDPVPLAERFFSAEEAASIKQAPKADQTNLFFALWTKKEALGKALGKGLADTLGKSIAEMPVHTERRALGGKSFFLSVFGNSSPIEMR